MSEKIKNLSTITKLFFLFALLLFIIWVIPAISSYYGNVNNYQKSSKELKTLALKYDITTQTEKFSEANFKKYASSLFSKVLLKNLGNQQYEVVINMKEEDSKTFRTFVETLSLRYYVKLKDHLEFTVKDKIITVRMQLIAF